MGILIVAEHDNAALKPATLNTLTAAGALAGDVDVLVAGADCAGAAEAAAKLPGVAKVLSADAPEYAYALAENVAPLVAKLASGYSHVLGPASTFGKNVMPRVAALLDVQQISDISGIESEDTFERPIYAGNALATVRSSDSIKVVTVRATAFDPAPEEGGSAPIEAVEAPETVDLADLIPMGKEHYALRVRGMSMVDEGIRDGDLVVWESHTIVRYLAARYSDGRLWPEDPAERSFVDRWLDWAATRLQPDFMALFWGYYRQPEAERDTAAIAAARASG